jgi:type IV pilus assembly protein PilA
LPTYQDYTIRAKVSELVLAAAAFKTTIAEKATVDGTLASAGLGLTVTTAGRISGGSVNDTGIITISGNDLTIGTAVDIVLTPSLGGGRVAWECSTVSSSQWKYVPPQCRRNAAASHRRYPQCHRYPICRKYKRRAKEAKGGRKRPR